MQEIINELRYYNRTFPRAALEEAIKNKEEITPILLDEMDGMIKNPDITNGDYMLHIYAIFLLAQFREKKAFPKILELISLPSDQVDVMYDTILTEDLNTILYSTFDGDFKGLKRVIENPLVNIYARGAALEVYGKLYADEIVTQEEIVTYLRKLLWGLNNYDTDTDLATTIQGVIIDRHLFEMAEDVQRLYDAHRIDEMMVGQYDDFIDYLYGYENVRERINYLEDVIQAMSWWAAFEQSEENKLKEEERLKKIEEMHKEMQQQARPATAKKVGRNDPCPCGSGKKYKKCCLPKETAYRKKGQEPPEIQNKWLMDYPKTADEERQENEVRITDWFDEEAIAIDRLVYLALHHRARPIWEQVDKEKKEKYKAAYLEEAFDKFKEKCEKEDIPSFEVYDKQHKIHYRSKDWINEFKNLIEKNNVTADREALLEEIEKLS